MHIKTDHITRVIAVTGGKGGVGKSNVSLNLAIALAKHRLRVAILDADLSLANINILLGLRVQRNLSHVLNGECRLADIVVEGPAQTKIIPAASGIQGLAQLSAINHINLIHAFSEIAADIDVLIVDTAAGIADSVINFASAAQEVLVVVCNEPTSITDSYALIKVLSQERGIERFHIVANMVHSYPEGQQLFRKLLQVSEKFLNVNLQFLGSIPFDDYVRKAVKIQQAVLMAYPSSVASRHFMQLAEQIMHWPQPEIISGKVSFFLEQIIQGIQPQQGIAS
ncbi:MAG: MinD/ParA family protein [Gammaproteobacteria bacterium]